MQTTQKIQVTVSIERAQNAVLIVYSTDAFCFIPLHKLPPGSKLAEFCCDFDVLPARFDVLATTPHQPTVEVQTLKKWQAFSQC